MKMNSDIKPFRTDYRIVKTLGKGEFGEVHLIEDQKGALFALKVAQKNTQTQAEVDINQKLADTHPAHSHVSSMPFKKMTVDYEGKIYQAEGFVGPYITYPSTNASGEAVTQSHTLQEFIHSIFHQQTPSLQTSKTIQQAFIGPQGDKLFESLVTGIHEAHHELADKRIIWGDLAPRNLMTTVEYNETGELVAIKPIAIDFGVSIALEREQQGAAPNGKIPLATTPLEAFKTGELDAKTDIFAKKVTIIASYVAMFTDTGRAADAYLYNNIAPLKNYQTEIGKGHKGIDPSKGEKEFLENSLKHLDALIEKSTNEPLKQNARNFLHPFKAYLLSEPSQATSFEEIVRHDKVLYSSVLKTVHQQRKHFEQNPEILPKSIFDTPAAFVPVPLHPLQSTHYGNFPKPDYASVADLTRENNDNKRQATPTYTDISKRVAQSIQDKQKPAATSIEGSTEKNEPIHTIEVEKANAPPPTHSEQDPSLFIATIRGIFFDAIAYFKQSLDLPNLLVNKALDIVHRVEEVLSQKKASSQTPDAKEQFQRWKDKIVKIVQPEHTKEEQKPENKP